MNRCVACGAAFFTVVTVWLASVHVSSQTATVSRGDTLVYVGTYTGAKTTSKGIYVFKLQGGQSPTLVPLGLAAETASPSFLEIDAARGLLFAVGETDEFEGKPSGIVSAFRIDRTTGRLTLINQRPSMGKAPCHLALDSTGRNLLIANYSSGNVSVLPVAADGRLGEPSDVKQHTGSSVNPQRQLGPHAHCTTLDPANRFAFVCDLGLDKVMAYRFDAAKGTLTPHEPAFATVKPGSGPRHMEFRPDGRFAYVTNEMTSTVTVFSYDPARGALSEVQTVSALPPGFQGANSGAEIAVHPSGRHLYVSNRGHNSIVLFDIDDQKGVLTYVGPLDTGGRTPRHFGIHPAAQYMGIANQASDTVQIATMDAKGRLKGSGLFVPVPSPVCVKFLPPR